jgi:hypothetical protein
MTVRTYIAFGLCALSLGACGSGGGGGETTTTSSVVETPQALPKLPPGWRPVVNQSEGFAFGLPPGWQARETQSGTSVLRTVDRRIAVSISADRTDQALNQPLGDYTTGAAKSLGGLSRIKVLGTNPLRDRYSAVEVRASGLGTGGIKEQAVLVGLRRDHLATFVVASLRRAGVPNAIYGAQVTRIVKTLRSRPIE